MSAPSTPTSMLTTPEIAQTTIPETEILVQEGALNTNTVEHMAIEPTHMSGMAARKKKVQVNMIKAIEAVYIFHVGDWDSASTRQLAETIRIRTTQIATNTDMKFSSTPVFESRRDWYVARARWRGRRSQARAHGWTS